MVIVDNLMDNIIGPQPAIDESAWGGGRSSIWVGNSRGLVVAGNEIRNSYDNGLEFVGNMNAHWTCHEPAEVQFNRLVHIAGNNVITPGKVETSGGTGGNNFAYMIAGSGIDSSGILTCFGRLGVNAPCGVPDWSSVWNANFTSHYYPANTATLGPHSDGACEIGAGTVGLTFGGSAEQALCQ